MSSLGLYVEPHTNNIGIGTTTPSQKLHVVGDARIQGNLTVMNTNTSGGNVGIGTNQPRAKLEVAGSIVPSTNVAYDLGSATLRWRDLYLSGNSINLGGTTISRDATTGGIKFLDPTTNQPLDSTVRNLTASNLTVLGDYVILDTITSNTEQMVIQNAGTGPALKVTQTGANTIAEFYDDGNVLALKIADGGNVGIGTANPLSKLQVIGTVQATTYSGKLEHTLSKGDYLTGTNFTNETSTSWAVDATSANTASKVVARDASGNFSAGLVRAANGTVGLPSFSWTDDTDNGLYLPATNTIGVVTAGAERIRVLSNGNVGIGTLMPTAPLHINSSSATLLRIQASSTNQSKIEIIAGSGTTNRASRIDLINVIASSSVPRWTIINDYNQTGVNDLRIVSSTTSGGVITCLQNENVGIGTTNPQYKLDVNGTIYASGDVIMFSDARKKTNIEVIPSALEKVLRIRGVTFEKLDGTDENQRRHAGVIAQEVEEVLPEVVYTAADGTKSVAYGNMIGLLIEAIKELAGKVDTIN